MGIVDMGVVKVAPTERVEKTMQLHKDAVESVRHAAQSVLDACGRIRDMLYVHSDDEELEHMCVGESMDYAQTCSCALKIASKYADTLTTFITTGGDDVREMLLDMLGQRVELMRGAFNLAVQTEAMADVELNEYQKYAEGGASSPSAVSAV